MAGEVSFRFDVWLCVPLGWYVKHITWPSINFFTWGKQKSRKTSSEEQPSSIALLTRWLGWPQSDCGLCWLWAWCSSLLEVLGEHSSTYNMTQGHGQREGGWQELGLLAYEKHVYKKREKEKQVVQKTYRQIRPFLPVTYLQPPCIRKISDKGIPTIISLGQNVSCLCLSKSEDSFWFRWWPVLIVNLTQSEVTWSQRGIV